MKIYKMSDLEARREARRAKILANAENRLRRLKNLDTKPSEEIDKYHVHNHIGNNDIIYGRNSNDILNSENNKESYKEEEVTTLFQSGNIPTESSTQVLPDRQEKLTHRIWIVVVLAVFIRYLNLVVENYSKKIEVDIAGLHVNKIFVPLILYEIFEFVVIRPPIVTSNFLPTILLLANIQPRYMHKIIAISNTLVKFFQDLMIYLFTFVVCDYFTQIMFEQYR